MDDTAPPAAVWMTAEVNPSSRTFRRLVAIWPTRDDAADSLVEAAVVGRRGLKNVETFAVIREDDLEEYVLARVHARLFPLVPAYLDGLDTLPCATSSANGWATVDIAAGDGPGDAPPEPVLDPLEPEPDGPRPIATAR